MQCLGQGRGRALPVVMIRGGHPDSSHDADNVVNSLDYKKVVQQYDYERVVAEV